MASTHLIRRELLDVEFVGTEADALGWHQRLPDLSRDWLNPALEKVLERMVPANEHWVVDTLFVDAGKVVAGDLERGLVEAVSNALERCLRERAPRAAPRADDSSGSAVGDTAPADIASGQIVSRTVADSVIAAFVHFLLTGALPWWFSLPPGKALEDCVRGLWHVGAESAVPAEQVSRAMLPAIRQSWPRTRLVRQFSADILAALLGGLSVQSERVVRAALAKWNEGDSGAIREFAEHLWERAFALTIRHDAVTEDELITAAYAAWISESPKPDESITMRIEKLWPQVPAASRRAPERARATRRLGRGTSAPLELEAGVFIGCAGVVLLHPFLPQLFEVLGIAREGELLEPDRALTLIHFLATGQREAPEHDLQFAKLLCNVPPDMPVQSRFELTAAAEEEAGAVLAAVIRHWDALGETSVEGLRGSFLVRPGKLSRRGESDVLQVESRAYDVLLDRLPWGIGLVQLPWMKNPLWVEWRF